MDSGIQEYALNITNKARITLPINIYFKAPDDADLYYGLDINVNDATLMVCNSVYENIMNYTIQGAFKNVINIYLYGEILFVVDSGDYYNQNSSIYKFNIANGQCIKRTDVKGIIHAVASDSKNMYFYIDNENENDYDYDLVNKRLLSYSLSKGTIKQIKKFNESWGRDDQSASSMDIAGGYIWGYCAIYNEMSYILCFSEPVPKQ